MSVIDEFPFHAQILIWGAAFSGDVAETAAVIAEHRRGKYLPARAFDLDESYLRCIHVHDQSGRIAVSEWWALPWVTEHVRRAEMAGAA